MATVRRRSRDKENMIRIDKDDPRYLTTRERSALKGELRILQSEINTLILPAMGPTNDKERAMIARRDEIQKKLDDMAALRKETKALRRADIELRREKSSKTERTRVQAELNAKQDKLEQEKIDRELKKLRAEKLAVERAGPDGMAQLGLQQHMDTVMPPSARAKGNAINKPDPIIGEVTENVPSVTVTKSPSSKSNIDTLAGSTTTASRNLNKIFTNGSAAAVKKTFESPEVKAANNIRDAEVNEVVKQATAATKDPFVQQAFKDIGMSEDEITEVNSQLETATDTVTNSVVTLKKEKTVDPQKLFSVKQFRQLGNPIGSPGTIVPDLGGAPNVLSSLQSKISENPFAKKIAATGASIAEGLPSVPGIDTGGIAGKFGNALEAFANGANPIAPGNPFGALGVEFGNVMASVIGQVNGMGAFKELGSALQSFPDGIDPVSKLPTPNIIEPTGKTQISKVVNKGTKTAVDEPTTPVKVVGKTKSTGIESLGYGALDDEFWGGYEPVNSKKEFELELKNCPRQIKHLLVDWTLSAENEFYTARKYNEFFYQFYLKKPQSKRAPSGGAVGREGYIRTNYLIRKDGVVERAIPIGTDPSTFFSSRLVDEDKDKYKRIHKQAIKVTFDAGLLGDQPAYKGIASVNLKQDWNNISSKSITPEQWKSFDMIVDIMHRHSPGGIYKGADLLLAEMKVSVPDNTPASSPKIVQMQRFVKLIGPQFDVGTYLLKKREIPDGDDGALESTPGAMDDDPYADLTDEYLNSDEDVE